MFTAMTSHITL